MTPLQAQEISAFRRPWLLLLLTLFRLGSGLLLAFPLACVVSGSGIGMRDEGDRALFEGGGYLLLEVLRLQGGALAATARGLLPVLAACLVLTGAANVALMLALNAGGPLRAGEWLSRALRLLPAQLTITASTALAKLALLLLGAMAVGAAPEWLAKPVDTSLVRLAAFLPFALLCGAVGGFEDLAKASLVRHPAPLAEGLGRAWDRLRRRPLTNGFGWVPYAALFVLVGLAAAQLVGVLDVSRAGAWRVAAVLLVQQLVIATGVACRAAWFARALRASD